MPELDITERLRLLPILPVREIRSEARDICRDAIHEITLLREREMLRDRGEPADDASGARPSIPMREGRAKLYGR